MKKVLKTLIVCALILSVLACCFACKGEEGNVKLHVVSADGAVKSYSVDTTDKDLTTLEDFMKYLKEKGEEFDYTASSGFVGSINGITPDLTKNEFWAIYTDVQIGEIKYYDQSFGTCEIDGVSYASALKGINELPLSAGATYIFKISTW